MPVAQIGSLFQTRSLKVNVLNNKKNGKKSYFNPKSYISEIFIKCILDISIIKTVLHLNEPVKGDEWVDNSSNFNFRGQFHRFCKSARSAPRQREKKKKIGCLHSDSSATYEPPCGKTNNVVSVQVRHKPTCTVTEKS